MFKSCMELEIDISVYPLHNLFPRNTVYTNKQNDVLNRMANKMYDVNGKNEKCFR